MKNLILLIVIVLLSSCMSSHRREEYMTPAGPPPTSPFFQKDYAAVCQQALAGNPSAIKTMLSYTRKFDGETLLNHGVNLIIVREKYSKIFGQQLRSLSEGDQQFIKSNMMSAEEILHLLDKRKNV